MKTRTVIALAAGAVAVAAAVFWLLQPSPVVVDTAQVMRGAFEQTVADDGKTRVRDRFVVSAPLAGRVERIRLRPGDRVERGQTVAVLTPAAPALLDARTERELEARVAAAEAQRLRAASEAGRAVVERDRAKNEVARQARLAQQGFVSRTALEQAEAALRSADKSVEAARFAEQAAQHEVTQARAARVRYRGDGVSVSARWEVKSPVRGAVLQVVHQSEGAVALGAPLLEIADARSLEAVVDVLSQDSVLIRAGAVAWLELGAGLPRLEGRVRHVEPAAFTKVSALGIEEQRVNVVIDFLDSAQPLESIGDGYRVEARIVVFRAADAVKVPVSALFRSNEAWAVYAFEDGRAVKKPVRLGRRNGIEAVVEEGLAPGERVIVYPPDALVDGARVKMSAAE